MINAYVIYLNSQKASVKHLEKSIEATSSTIKLWPFNATTPDTLLKDLAGLKYLKKYRWNWPTVPMMDDIDIATGLYKKCYRASNQAKVEACAISHLRAWEKCIDMDEPIIVFEADAYMTRHFDDSEFEGKDYQLVGLNDPRGATRKSDLFHAYAQKLDTIGPPPVFKEQHPVPHGIAGNSAYYITPAFARKLIRAVDQFGMWPNDAIMCVELFPEMKIVYPYYSKVQGTESTTTG